MSSCQCLTLLFLTALLICCRCSISGNVTGEHNYKCLLPGTNGADLAAGIREFQLAKLKQMPPGCAGRLHYCNYFGVLFLDRSIMHSDAFILVANWRDCEMYKAHILDGLDNASTKIGYQNLVNRCSGLTIGKVASWMTHEYTFRALMQCLDVACTDASALADWQKDQLGYCRRYLN